MKKLVSVSFIALIITFVLFAFMAKLITNEDTGVIIVEPFPVVNVYQTPKDSPVIEKVKTTLSPPEAPKPMPKIPQILVEPIQETVAQYTQPNIDLTPDNNLVVISKPTDMEASPIFRVNPKYPITAMNKGIEGWVTLSFSIGKLGEVIDVEVIDAEPKRLFNKAAKQALKKWKYRAKFVDGQPVIQKNLAVKLDFAMNQQS